MYRQVVCSPSRPLKEMLVAFLQREVQLLTPGCSGRGRDGVLSLLDDDVIVSSSALYRVPTQLEDLVLGKAKASGALGRAGPECRCSG